MHRFLRPAAVAAAFAAIAATAIAVEQPAGYFDIGKITPPVTGEYVEINLQPGLLKIVASIAGAQDPEAADLLRNLQHIRVNVVKLDDTNRASTTERMESVRKELAAQGWTEAVTVREQRGSNVDIHVKTRGEEAIEGLVVTVMDKNDKAVFVNVVGNIKPEQLAALGRRLDIEPLKKLHHLKPADVEKPVEKPAEKTS